MNRVLTVYKTFGAQGLIRRVIVEIRKKSSAFRSRSKFTLTGGGESAPLFWVSLQQIALLTSRKQALERGNKVKKGFYEAYGWDWRLFPKTPREWNRNSQTLHLYPRSDWWRMPHLLAQAGDIKDAWEPARFGWVYDLIRSYALTDDPSLMKCFLGHFRKFQAGCPPFRGVQWSCGQEAAIRAFAVLFAESTFPWSKNDRNEILQFLAATGERIYDNIGYALSQRNNHGLSEAAGLALIGERLGRLHPESETWRKKGIQFFDRLINEQFAEDGWYIQHSFNYMRMALELTVLVRAGLPKKLNLFSKVSQSKLKAAYRLLLSAINPEDGQVPNYGANDGSRILPLDTSDYNDYRPTALRLAAALGLPFPKTFQVSNEALAWLCLKSPKIIEMRFPAVVKGTSGWVVGRKGIVRVFFRSGRYESRPSHWDPLHCEIRAGKKILAADPGTYKYYDENTLWKNSLAFSECHNGPQEVSNALPTRWGPFLWTKWPSAKLGFCGVRGNRVILKGECDNGFIREIQILKNKVRIKDLNLQANRAWLTRWITPKTTQSVLKVEEGIRKVKTAKRNSSVGWISSYYGKKTLCSVIEIYGGLRKTQKIVTTFHNKIIRQKSHEI